MDKKIRDVCCTVIKVPGPYKLIANNMSLLVPNQVKDITQQNKRTTEQFVFSNFIFMASVQK